MYSVFIVDDEVVVRDGLRSGIPWGQSGFSLAGEAADGEMALAILKDVKPDILVTDIKMPFMDGLSLAKIVKQTQPWVKIVILSGFDQFQFAREAISIGVEEYILKPVSAADMLTVLGKVAARIDEEKRNLNDLASLKQQVLSTADALAERWLGDLVTGAIDPAEALVEARDRGIDLIARHYAAVVTELSVPDDDFKELAKARRSITAHAALRGDAIHFAQGGERVVCLVKGDNPAALEESAYALAQGLKFEVERDTRCLASVGIGSAAERVAGISRSYGEALRALKFLKASGRRAILGIGDMQTMDDADLQKIWSDPVANKLRCAARADIDCLVDEYSNMRGKNEGKASFVGYYILYDLHVAAARVLSELGMTPAETFPESSQARLSEIAASGELFAAEVRKIIAEVINYREAAGESRYREVIQRAKRYIDENYATPDLSLHTVADSVHLSPNRLSTIFSQESGESFIDYLTCIRIEKAKKLLLNTSMKSVDISWKVGFNDPHYFSFIFKKHTGLSPREFRTEKNVTSR
jgi:two-component system response regulator YesN